MSDYSCNFSSLHVLSVRVQFRSLQLYSEQIFLFFISSDQSKESGIAWQVFFHTCEEFFSYLLSYNQIVTIRVLKFLLAVQTSN